MLEHSLSLWFYLNCIVHDLLMTANPWCSKASREIMLMVDKIISKSHSKFLKLTFSDFSLPAKQSMVSYNVIANFCHSCAALESSALINENGIKSFIKFSFSFITAKYKALVV